MKRQVSKENNYGQCPSISMKTYRKKLPFFVLVLILMLSAIMLLFSSSHAGSGFNIDNGTQTGLHGTLWKIISWATNDEHAGFYNGEVYYVVRGDYFSTDVLADSFYREYDRCCIACAVVPEKLINYAGDAVLWGCMDPRLGIGIGFSLPLPVRALLVMVESDWNPYDP